MEVCQCSVYSIPLCDDDIGDDKTVNIASMAWISIFDVVARLLCCHARRGHETHMSPAVLPSEKNTWSIQVAGE